jgi:trigger factor
MIRRLASAYNDPESVARYYYSNEEQLAQVEQAVLEEQVVELVVSESGVTEVAASYDELIAPRPNPGAVS